MIYDIIHNIEKHIPHDSAEVRSKVLHPTYRFVTSANFILGVIVVVVFLVILLMQYANGFEQEVIDNYGIKNIVVTDLNHNTNSVVFEYCFNKYTLDSVGALVTSDLDAVPVPIDSDSIKYGKCAIYGTTFIAESNTVNVTLFDQKRVDALISSFNVKVIELQDSLSSIQQKIIHYKKIGYDDDKIYPLEQQSKLLEKQLKSAQSGLKTLIAMKSS